MQISWDHVWSHTNFLARSVQPFGRLSVTNKQTPTQTQYIYRCDVKILHRPLLCFFLFLFKTCTSLYCSKTWSTGYCCKSGTSLYIFVPVTMKRITEKMKRITETMIWITETMKRITETMKRITETMKRITETMKNPFNWV